MSKEKRFYIIISALLSLVVVTSLGIGLYGYLTFTQKQASNAEAKYYVVKLAEKKEILDLLKTRYDDASMDLPLIDIALPSDKDSSKLLSDFSSLAKSSGLKLITLEPNSDSGNSKNTKTKTITDLGLLQTVKGSNGYELPLTIGVSGSYSNFLNFVQKIENYQRLINIESIEITKEENESISDYIEARINVRAYIKR